MHAGWIVPAFRSLFCPSRELVVEMIRPSSSFGPWRWVPSLYFAEGIPYVVVMTVAVVLYKRMGIANADIALYTSWLYLPWVIKPLWSPFVDLVGTKRLWVLVMQLLIGAGLAGVALTLPLPNFFQWTLAMFWLLAFSSATHDIAADGFYMLGLDESQQAFFVGIRSTFYRLAMIAGQGLLIMLAGALERGTGLAPASVTVHAAAAAAHEAELRELPQVEAGGILFGTEAITLPLGATDAERTSALRAEVQAWNAARGFLHEEPRPSVEEQRLGPIAVVPLRIGRVPAEGERIVVTLERVRGDSNLKLVSSETLHFTAANARETAYVAVELDPNARAPTSARFEARAGNIPLAWSITFFVLSGLFVGLCVWHRFALPVTANDVAQRHRDGKSILSEFWSTFASFFRRRDIGIVLAFLLLYRFGEAQLVKLAAPFLLDTRSAGGLSLSTGAVGFAYGTIGVLMLTIGGILGGLLVARHGLRRWLLPMVAAINLPNAVYIWLAAVQPEAFGAVVACVAIEQFGYGFGFTAYMMYMIMIARGPHRTAHFAITTGFMALGMMLPGMFSGWLQEALGYHHFFVWVMIATIPGFVVAALVRIEPGFGRKEERA